MQPKHRVPRMGSGARRWISALAICMLLVGSEQSVAGVIYDSLTGHGYETIYKSCAWGTARDSAKSLGGKLAVITSADEQAFIYALGLTGRFWIGGLDSAQEGQWEWVDGEPWAYANWLTGEPNNNGNEDYAAIYFDLGGKWNDVKGGFNLNGFIVEYESPEFPSVTGLSFGDASAPLLAESPTPVIYWKVTDTLPGSPQGVEIEVGDDIDWTVAEEWQSGQILTGDTSMAYTGTSLHDSRTYYLRIRIFNGSAWSEWTAWQFRVDYPTLILVPDSIATVPDAIAACGANDTIVLAAGTWILPQTTITKSVAIRSADGPDLTNLVPQTLQTGSFITVQAGGHLSLAGFTMRGMAGVGQIIATDASLDLSDMVFDQVSAWKSSLIRASGSSACRVKRCIFDHVTAAAWVVQADTTAALEFVNNTVYACSTTAVGSPGPTTVIKNNIFAQCAIALNLVSTDRESFNCFWQNQADHTPTVPLGTGSFDLDPQLPSATLKSFALDRQSPCIDAGDADSLFSDPDGSRNDLGAVPFDPQNINLDAIFFNGAIKTDHVLPTNLTFGWSYVHPEEISRQGSYQFEIGEATWRTGIVWNSDQVNSSDTAFAYGGPSLVRHVPYAVRVRIFDGTSWSSWFYGQFQLNGKPPLPVHTLPIVDGLVTDSVYDLMWGAQLDPDGDRVKFDVEVYADSGLTQLVSGVNGYGELTYYQSWQPHVIGENKSYYWRIRSTDGYEITDWTSARRYFVNCIEEFPRIALPLSPTNPGAPVYTLHPEFTWRTSYDADPLDTITYDFEIASDPGFVIKYDTLVRVLSFPLPGDLAYGEEYWWRVTAIDRTDRKSLSPTVSFRIYQLGDLTNDFSTDISDLTRLLGYLFIDLEPLSNPALGDLNGDCTVDIIDLTLMIDHLFISFSPLAPGCTPPPGE